jgi:hypothetical protein
VQVASVSVAICGSAPLMSQREVTAGALYRPNWFWAEGNGVLRVAPKQYGKTGEWKFFQPRGNKK